MGVGSFKENRKCLDFVNFSDFLQGESVSQITAGEHISMVCTNLGRVFAFGWDICGTISTMDHQKKNETGNFLCEIENELLYTTPKLVHDFGGIKCKHIRIFTNVALVLLENGSIWTWGHQNYIGRDTKSKSAAEGKPFAPGKGFFF